MSLLTNKLQAEVTSRASKREEGAVAGLRIADIWHGANAARTQ